MEKTRRFMTGTLAFALALALVMGLAGCGSSSSAQSGTEESDEPQSEYTYVPEYTELDMTFDSGVYTTAVGDDCFYAVCNEVVGNNMPEGATLEYEGQYDVYGSVLYKLGFDGSVEKLGFTPTALEEGQNGSASVSAIAPAADGTLYLLEDVYTYTINAPEGVDSDSDEYWDYYESNEKYYVRHVAADGSDINTIDLTEASNTTTEDGFYAYRMTVDAEGNIYVPGDSTLYVMDPEGTLSFTIETDGWIDDISLMADGSVACVMYESGYKLVKVNTETQAFDTDEAMELPDNVYSILTGGGDYDFYYSNSVYFYGYDVETETATKLFNWLSLGVDSYDMSSIAVLSDGRVCGLTNTWNSDYTEVTCELTMLTQQPSSSVTQKETITLATLSLDYDSRSQIVEFNKTNSEYTIEVIDYSEYNTDDDYSAGQTKLTTEILSGNMPDILDLNGMPYEQLAAKGLLEDLYPYLDSDSELSRDDILSSVLTALEYNGALYSTCSDFSVFTCIGASSVVGDEPGWTLDEFNAALASMPEGCEAFDVGMTRDTIMYYCLALDLDSFVDWSTGECSFDSEGFIDMLEFIAQFPEEFDWENYGYTEEDDKPNRVAAGKQMLALTSLSEVTDFQTYEAIFGGDVTCIGFPTASGTGNMLSLSTGYAISASSENKDAAWQFLRTFFTEEYQEESVYNYPTNVNAFNAKMEEAMTPEYETDENGNYVLDEDGNKIEVSDYVWAWGDIEIHVMSASQEEVDQLMELINSTTKVMKVDESIQSIVEEEAAAYFEGQKTAEEVAKIIQSKATIYVNEQR